MLIKIEERAYPHFRAACFAGESSVGILTTYSAPSEKLHYDSVALSVDRLPSPESVRHALSNFEEKTVVNISGLFLSRDLELSVTGILKEDKMLVGVPSGLRLYIDSYVIFLTQKLISYSSGDGGYIYGFKSSNLSWIPMVAKEIPDVEVKSYTILDRLRDYLPYHSARVINYHSDGSLFLEATLSGEDLLDEREGLLLIDTETKQLTQLTVKKASDLEVECLQTVNTAVRESSKLAGPITTFPTALSNEVAKQSWYPLTSILSDFSAIFSIRSYKLTLAQYTAVLNAGSFSYDQLKSLLESNLAFADRLGNVRMSNFNEGAKLLSRVVIASSDEINISAQEKHALYFSDEVFSIDSEKIKARQTLEDLKGSIKRELSELSTRIMNYSRTFESSYVQALSNLARARDARQLAYNNVKGTAASAKVFLDQLEAINALEVRSWWNNCFMGNLGSYYDYAVESNQVKLTIDKEKVKRDYNSVSSDYEYKWSDCDYWIPLRSGSPNHTYFGKSGANSDRVKDDWRYNATEYPITIPESSLINLKVPVRKTSPQTATLQGYTSCGKFKTVVSPATQIARPELGLNSLESTIFKAVKEILTQNLSFVKLIAASKDTLQKAEALEAKIALEVGAIEALRFKVDALSDYKMLLEMRLANLEELSVQDELVDLHSLDVERDAESKTIPLVLSDELAFRLHFRDINKPDLIVKKKRPFTLDEVKLMLEAWPTDTLTQECLKSESAFETWVDSLTIESKDALKAKYAEISEGIDELDKAKTLAKMKEVLTIGFLRKQLVWDNQALEEENFKGLKENEFRLKTSRGEFVFSLSLETIEDVKGKIKLNVSLLSPLDISEEVEGIPENFYFNGKQVSALQLAHELFLVKQISEELYDDVLARCAKYSKYSESVFVKVQWDYESIVKLNFKNLDTSLLASITYLVFGRRMDLASVFAMFNLKSEVISKESIGLAAIVAESLEASCYVN